MIKHFAVTAFLSVSLLAAANPPGVPKEAKAVTSGQYAYTDKDGKHWTYRVTPFGVQKSEDKGGEQSGAAEGKADPSQQQSSPGAGTPGTTMATPFGNTKSRAAVPVKVTEDGDMLRFERPTPFGPQRWTRKKNELTEQEAAIWQEQRKEKTTNNAK